MINNDLTVVVFMIGFYFLILLIIEVNLRLNNTAINDIKEQLTLTQLELENNELRNTIKELRSQISYVKNSKNIYS